MKKLQNGSAFFFIIAVVVLSAISIMGVWNIFSHDVITKSFETLGLLAGVSVLIMVAGRFVDSKEESALVMGPDGQTTVVPDINPTFTSIRHLTVGLLVVSVSILALLGIMAIWEVLAGDVLSKSVSSIVILAFASLIITITCLDRERHKLLNQKISGGVVLVVAILAWIFFVSIF
ncbi:MAG: hypothetical protein JWN50_448 [Parcubacteria group bacterium]|nr:hypothetical protein [Parcubacteria group bacterium]